MLCLGFAFFLGVASSGLSDATERVAREALDTQLEHHGMTNGTIRRTVARLVRLYKVWDRPGEADAWYRAGLVRCVLCDAEPGL